jgi:hypothetical protein
MVSNSLLLLNGGLKDARFFTKQGLAAMPFSPDKAIIKIEKRGFKDEYKGSF